MADPAPLIAPAAGMRLDLFLWFARIVRSRAVAQAMAMSGRLRLDGRAIDRAAAAVRVGNILTFVTPGVTPGTGAGRVRAIRVEALPPRRGPPPEALACYTELLVGTAQSPPANVSQQAAAD